MRVVSNTSPIINLAGIGRLDLLRSLYRGIVIPRAVYEEITRFGPDQPGAAEVQNADWITVREVDNRYLVEALKFDLDPGEAEAIACAMEIKAHRLLIDERLGRLAAQRLGLEFVGLLGVLIEAKKGGLITAVKPLVDDLVARSRFWIRKPVYLRVLEAAGEL